MKRLKPDYIPEPLIYEPESYVRDKPKMNISSIQINKNVWIPSVVLVFIVITGCVYWSWAILVGAILGWLFGLMWAFDEVRKPEEDPDWDNAFTCSDEFDEYMENLLEDERYS